VLNLYNPKKCGVIFPTREDTSRRAVESAILQEAITIGVSSVCYEESRMAFVPNNKLKSMTTKIEKNEDEQKVLNEYLADLYGIFLTQLGEFVNDKKDYSEDAHTRGIKLMAILQEITKIKKLTVLNI
jgi:hypothetical protein